MNEAPPDLVPARRGIDVERADLAAVGARRELDDHAAFVAREERADRELDLVTVHHGVGAGRGDEAHALGQLETHAGVLDRGAGGLLELAMEELRERRAVLHEGEVAVTVLREAAHVALVEVEADAERRHGDARREARAREVLGLGARAVEAVAHEDDATHATTRGLVERAEAVREAARDVRAAARVELARSARRAALRTLPTRASGWIELARVRVADDGDLVVVAHVREEAEHRATGLFDLLAAHRAGGVEDDREGDRRALRP